ncbi:MAG: glycosyltransferase [Bacteroidetes bacterium]|nr:glycosyltransferase [Bacteroidota bacterium]
MFFSIVIPTYNRSKLITGTIQSVLMQSYPHFEILVIDDGSTDNTEEVVNSISDKRIRYFKKANEERAAARNYGTMRAKGHYITFLDSDDILSPNFLKEALAMCDRENNPEWFHIRYMITDDMDNVLARKHIYNNNDPNKRLFYEGNFISCIGVFLRKDIALENLFNEDRRLTISEDHELWMRLAIKYPLKINKLVSAKLIQHDHRSVGNRDVSGLILCKEISLEIVFSNPASREYIRGHEGQVIASSYSYISLHMALTGQLKLQAISYTLKAIKSDPAYLFTRRFLATIKHLLFTYS